MAKLTVMDLFSGLGGFSLGLERTNGFETTSFCELDPFCRRVLAKHWPHVPCSEDITKREFLEGEADVITAGFPCQDISLAGRGAGLAGARSGLWREVVRAVRLVRPQFAILENVAALLNRGLDRVLGDLAEIGYDAEWHCIPASAVGAPHRRDRIWIVADTRGKQHQGDSTPLSGEIAAQLSRTDTDAAAVFGAAIIGSEQNRNHASFGEMADAQGERFDGCWPWPELAGRPESTNRSWWSAEPAVDRMAYGVRSRVDRLRALGNSVVPQVVTLIGNALLASRDQPRPDPAREVEGAAG